MIGTENKKLEEALNQKLREYTSILNFGHNLRVEFDPNPNSKLDGEVHDDVISIYVESAKQAEQVLEHELIDFLVAEGIRPYAELLNAHRAVINCLFKGLESKAYQQKERAVEAISKLVRSNINQR